MACMEHECCNWVIRWPWLPTIVVSIMAQFGVRPVKQCGFFTANNKPGPFVCPDCGGTLVHSCDEYPERPSRFNDEIFIEGENIPED